MASPRSLSLAPTARELDVEANFLVPLEGGHFSLGAAYTATAGHVRGRDGAAVWARLVRRF